MDGYNQAMAPVQQNAQAASELNELAVAVDTAMMDPVGLQAKYINGMSSTRENPQTILDTRDRNAELHANHRTWLDFYRQCAKEAVSIAQTAQDPGVRAAAFGTAAYLAATSYWQPYRDAEVEGIETAAVQLARTEPGEPVLVMGQSIDGSRKFSGGTLDGQLEISLDERNLPGPHSQHLSAINIAGNMIEHRAYRPTGTVREAYLQMQAAAQRAGIPLADHPPTQNPVRIRQIDILQSGPLAPRLITGTEYIAATVGQMLGEQQLDAYSIASLIESLDFTGKPLTELGFTADSLAAATAHLTTELDSLGDPERPDAPHGTFNRAEQLQRALQTIQDQNQQTAQ